MLSVFGPLVIVVIIGRLHGVEVCTLSRELATVLVFFGVVHSNCMRTFANDQKALKSLQLAFQGRIHDTVSTLKLMGWRVLIGMAKLLIIAVINRLLEVKILWHKRYWWHWIEWSIPPVWYTSQAFGLPQETLMWMLSSYRGTICDFLALVALPLVAVGLGAALTPLVFEKDDRNSERRSSRRSSCRRSSRLSMAASAEYAALDKLKGGPADIREVFV
jgi:hypothetical protein